MIRGGHPAWKLGERLTSQSKKPVCYEMSYRASISTDILERSRHRKMDMRFATCKVRSLQGRFTENSSKRIGQV
jgi:hypothetical protein